MFAIDRKNILGLCNQQQEFTFRYDIKVEEEGQQHPTKFLA